MKTFYLFKINDSYKKITKKTPNNIYNILESIYKYDKKDIKVPFNIFNEICRPINNNFFNNYIYIKLKNNEEYTKFKNIHMYYNYFTEEMSKMIIGKSHIKIKSNTKENIFINNLKELGNIFLCDFENEDYEYFFKNKEKNKYLVK